MKNTKKEDQLSINSISAPGNITQVSNGPVGNAGKDPFCVYANARHAVGSIIKNEDGREIICTEDGTWQNK